MILADHGARVISIESRRFENEALPMLANINRNKEHMSLNLKTGKGRDIFFRLARRADIIVEGFRPGVTDRLGVGYMDIRRINPGIIYCSITGYGQTGPLKDRAGHDINYMGYGGALSLMGHRDHMPCIPGIQIADIAGGMNGALGILLALQARARTGEGQYIDISMTDCVTALLPVAAGTYWTLGTAPRRGDSVLSHRYAFYNVYETKDGKYLTVGALESRFWAELCNFFTVPEYIPLQFDDTRREEIISFFRKTFATRTRDEWMTALNRHDVCVGCVYDTEEALNGSNATRRDMAIHHAAPDGSTLSMLGIPIKLSGTPGSVRRRPPRFGQDTEEILMEMGYSRQDIRDFARQGVI